jgi:hypothetical protein
LGPGSWLPTHGHVSSPIQTGDALFVADNPTEVVSVSPGGILARDLLSGITHAVSPQNRSFRDTAHMLSRGRASTRNRAAPAFASLTSRGLLREHLDWLLCLPGPQTLLVMKPSRSDVTETVTSHWC